MVKNVTIIRHLCRTHPAYLIKHVTEIIANVNRIYASPSSSDSMDAILLKIDTNFTRFVTVMSRVPVLFQTFSKEFAAEQMRQNFPKCYQVFLDSVLDGIRDQLKFSEYQLMYDDTLLNYVNMINDAKFAAAHDELIRTMLNELRDGRSFSIDFVILVTHFSAYIDMLAAC